MYDEDDVMYSDDKDELLDLSFLNNSIGKTIRLERGGPDKLIGKLVAIMNDALVVETKHDGIIYVNSQHIKAISEPVVPELQTVGTAGLSPVSDEEKSPFVQATDLRDLFAKLRHRLVRINHGGPNALQGVLIDIRPDVVTILHEMLDYVHFPIYHIKSVTWILDTGDKKHRESESSVNEKGKK